MKNIIKNSIFLLVAGLFLPAQLLCGNSDLEEMITQELSTMGKEVMGEGARCFFQRRSFQEGTLTSTLTMATLLAASSYASAKGSENPSLAKSALCDSIAGTTLVLGAACGLCAYHGAGPFDLPAVAPTIAKNLPIFVFGTVGLLGVGSSLRHFVRYVRGK